MFLKDIRTWFECIKRIRPNIRNYKSPFLNLANAEYSCSEVYLGAKGIINIYPEGLVLSMSFSVRDGILINIKKNHPYQVLFDYVDGAYYINDDSIVDYIRLVELLSKLKAQTKNLHHAEIFEKLEALMFDYVTKTRRYGTIAKDEYT